MSIWYKALIVAIWLCVPVAGSLLVRGSYQRYIEECAVQRQDCLDRGALLTAYAPAYLDLVTRSGWIKDREDHRTWVLEFRDLQDMETLTASNLRPEEPIHYPTADSKLGELEAQLKELASESKSAANSQLDFLNTGTRLESLQGAKFDLDKTIHYYKQIGMEGIYLQLQEDLARVEDEIRIIKRKRRAHLDAFDDSLSDAQDFHRSILRGLSHLDDQIVSDENQTFRQELNLRLADFNLAKEISGLYNKAE